MFSRFDEDDSGTLSFGECFCLIPELEKAIVQSARQDQVTQKLKSVSMLAGEIRHYFNLFFRPTDKINFLETNFDGESTQPDSKSTAESSQSDSKSTGDGCQSDSKSTGEGCQSDSKSTGDSSQSDRKSTASSSDKVMYCSSVQSTIL